MKEWKNACFSNVTLFQNKEPQPYYNGWAEKFMIQDQIRGKTGTQYKLKSNRTSVVEKKSPNFAFVFANCNFFF